MANRLDEALDFAAQTLGLELKRHQTTALRQLVQGHDLFVNLPTGFGKSIIFQAATIVLDFLNESQTGEIHDKALVFVVLPLKALAVDQLDRVKKIGLNAPPPPFFSRWRKLSLIPNHCTQFVTMLFAL